MKKDHQEVLYLPVTGKDELNLIECPFTLLTDRSDRQKTIEFIDHQNGITRHWTITGSDKYGLPTALDEPVYIAMLFFSKQDGFNNHKVYFNQREILDLMKWPINGDHYHRLSLAFSRLSGVLIETDYLWDTGEFKKGDYKLHIIGDVELYHGKEKGTKSSFFIWGDRLFKSFENGNLKNLAIEVYFDLKTTLSKRLYRLWSKRLYKNDRVSFDLIELAHEKLGLTRNLKHFSEIKRKIDPALEEHQAKNLLSSAVYTKTQSGLWLLTLKKFIETKTMLEPKPDPVITLSSESIKTIINPLVAQLITLGISKKASEELVTTINHGIVENQIEALQYRKNIDDKAGFLIKAIQEDYPLPTKFKKKLAQKQAENEDRLKSEYNQFIISQVDQYISTIDKKLVELELQEYMIRSGADEDFINKSHWRDYYLPKFKLAKSKTLNLPDFLEWAKAGSRS